QHVRRPAQPGGGAVAVLGERAARARGDQRRGRRHVERRLAAPGPGGVDQVAAVGRHGGRERAHGPGQAGELVDRLPLRPQRDEEPGDLRLGGVAAHDLAEDGAGLLAREVVAGGERVDGACEDVVGHQFRARKFWSRAFPDSVSTDSGWNCTPSAGSSRWRIAITTPPPRAETSNASGTESSATTSESYRPTVSG